jgi:alkanesulfonate monooxygenase SsuD/methylene tetrahydromethanopterin reductase-like flavin-dependent oxidoreductase (luciferase family)
MAGQRVQVGFNLPNCGGVLCEPEWARPKTIIEIAGEARDHGFDSVWLNDHLLTPRELQHLTEPAFYECLTTNAVVAASIPDILVGVASLILPLRNPLVVAKQIMTLEGFFPGRTAVCFGTGRYESEYVASGNALFRKRGRVLDEYLEIVRSLLAGETVTYAGEFHSLESADFHPTAQSYDRPSIWVAGNTRVGARRAKRFATTWIVTQHVSPARIVEYLAPDEGTAGDRRPHVALTLTVASPEVARSADPDDAQRVHRHAEFVTGHADDVADAINEYVRVGVRHLVLAFRATDRSMLTSEMEWFARDVRPLLEQPPI